MTGPCKKKLRECGRTTLFRNEMYLPPFLAPSLLCSSKTSQTWVILFFLRNHWRSSLLFRVLASEYSTATQFIHLFLDCSLSKCLAHEESDWPVETLFWENQKLIPKMTSHFLGSLFLLISGTSTKFLTFSLGTVRCFPETLTLLRSSWSFCSASSNWPLYLVSTSSSWCLKQVKVRSHEKKIQLPVFDNFPVSSKKCYFAATNERKCYLRLKISSVASFSLSWVEFSFFSDFYIESNFWWTQFFIKKHTQ